MVSARSCALVLCALCIHMSGAKPIDVLLHKPSFAWLDSQHPGLWSSNSTEPAAWTVSSFAKPDQAAASAVVRELREENDWKNDLILFWFPSSIRNALPRIVHSWLRNWIACMGLYFTVSGAWAYYGYWVFGKYLYKPGHIPPSDAVVEQAWVAIWAMPGYAVLPAVTEWIVEGGHTLTYTRVESVGVPMYCLYFAAYMTAIEFLVYWTHRILHEHRPSFRALHYIHHKYNKEHTLSPFAGLAFHPVDGIVQAIPYSMMLFFVPMHFLTFELLLFMTGVWTTNIHDCLHGKIMPIMGGGYHTIHHTTYQHNYGHYFIYFDWLFGTLEFPEEFSAKREAQRGAALH